MLMPPLYMNDYDFFVAVGNNTMRETIQENIENLGASISNLIYPTAIIGKQVSLDKVIAIMTGSVINCSTVAGKGSIINTSASVGHDNSIGDNVHISSRVNIVGTVNIGDRTWMGIGSVLSNNISIYRDCKMNPGAVLIHDIKEKGTHVGVPARSIVDG